MLIKLKQQIGLNDSPTFQTKKYDDGDNQETLAFPKFQNKNRQFNAQYHDDYTPFSQLHKQIPPRANSSDTHLVPQNKLAQKINQQLNSRITEATYQVISNEEEGVKMKKQLTNFNKISIILRQKILAILKKKFFPSVKLFFLQKQYSQEPIKIVVTNRKQDFSHINIDLIKNKKASQSINSLSNNQTLFSFQDLHQNNLTFQIPFGEYIQQSSIFQTELAIERYSQIVEKNKELALKINEFLCNRLFFESKNYQNSFNRFTFENKDLFMQETQKSKDKRIDFENLVKKIGKDTSYQTQVEIPINEVQVNHQDIVRIQSALQIMSLFNEKFDIQSFRLLSNPSKMFYLFLIHPTHILNLPIRNQDYLYFASSASPNQNDYLSVFFDAINSTSSMPYILSKIPAQFQSLDIVNLKQFFSKFNKDQLNFTIRVKPYLQEFSALKEMTLKVAFLKLCESFELGCSTDYFKMIKKGQIYSKLLNSGFDKFFETITDVQGFITWMHGIKKQIIQFQNFSRALLGQSNSSLPQKLLKPKLSFIFSQFVEEIENLAILSLKQKYLLDPLPIQVQNFASSIFFSAPNEIQRSVFFTLHPQNMKSYIESGHVYAKKLSFDIVFIYQPNPNSNILNKIIVSSSDKYIIQIETDFNADKQFIIKDLFFQIKDVEKNQSKYFSNENLYFSIIINKLIKRVKQYKDFPQQQSIDIKDIFVK